MSHPITNNFHNTFHISLPESRTGRARREESPEFEQLQAQIDALRFEIELTKKKFGSHSKKKKAPGKSLNLKFPGQTSSV